MAQQQSEKEELELIENDLAKSFQSFAVENRVNGEIPTNTSATYLLAAKHFVNRMAAYFEQDRQQAIDQAHQQGRIDEAKTCEEARRHDCKRAVAEAKRALLLKLKQGHKNPLKKSNAEIILNAIEGELAQLQGKETK